ncbi:MAG: TetR/AcrR family transcriptional regulator [Actinomycetota bacterium]
METGTAGLVRAPQQDRSRRAVRKLLDSAEATFAEQGYDRASVRSIAAHAGVPKGTLYQFFVNKEAVLDAVVADLVEEVDRIFGQLSAVGLDSERTPVESMVGHVVDGVLDLASRRPAFRTLFSGLATTGPLAAAGVRIRQCYRAHTEAALGRVDRASPVAFAKVSTVCTEITRGLLPSIVDERGHIDRQLAPELSFAISSYLTSVKQRSERR